MALQLRQPGAIVAYRAPAICLRLMPVMSACRTYGCFRAVAALRTELDVDVLPGVADLLVNDELLVLEEVGDLELRLRLHDLALTGLQAWKRAFVSRM